MKIDLPDLFGLAGVLLIAVALYWVYGAPSLLFMSGIASLAVSFLLAHKQNG